MIKLKKTDARIFHGIVSYLVSYDHAAGLPGRYTVMALNVDDPVVIGRELPIDEVGHLIEDFEEQASRLSFYTGERGDVEITLQRMLRHRRHQRS